jgi:folate-binding Fe-S cluster repair protein YgfZ
VCEAVACAAAFCTPATTTRAATTLKCLRKLTFHQDNRCFLTTSTTPRTIPPRCIERSSQGTVALTGADRASFLHGLLTNDIASLPKGRGVYAAYLTPQGRMISDMRVIETGSRLLLSVDRDVAAPLAERFDKLVFSEDVQAKDASDMAILGVHGPSAARMIQHADWRVGCRPRESVRQHHGGVVDDRAR